MVGPGDELQKIASSDISATCIGALNTLEIVHKLQLVKRRPPFDPSIPATPHQRRARGQEDLKDRRMDVTALSPIQEGRWRRL
jgi:hypothetical protein